MTIAWIFVASTVHGNVHAEGLFGSKNLRGNLSILTRWRAIMLIGEKEFTFFSTCVPGSPGCPAASVRWNKLEKRIVHEPRLDQAKDVNAFFNHWPYILDEDIYGKRDHWASPLEFITRSGDCEDYAITKYFALKQMGFDPANMRIVILKDTIRNITHAVLTLTIAKTNYVLDNMTDLLLENHGKHLYILRRNRDHLLPHTIQEQEHPPVHRTYCPDRSGFGNLSVLEP
jgi:predicted transglutaminase-like cysteine proteinase